MSNLATQARPYTVETIRGMAQTVRAALGYEGIAAIPAVHMLEFALPEFCPPSSTT